MMRLPGEEGVEFTLLQPMVPTSRPNMIAWIAARMDDPNYGSTVVYRFPADSTIFGPAQIEARIDQDAAISQQISLWDQSGSKVIRGNLIVVPIDESLDLPAAGLPAVDRLRVPRVPADRRRVAARGGLGRDPRRSRCASCSRPRVAPAPGPTPTPGHVADTRTRARRRHRRPGVELPGRRSGPDRLRERPLRARPGRLARWRLRPLRDGDRARRGGARAAPGPRTRARVPGPEASAAPRRETGGGAHRGAARRPWRHRPRGRWPWLPSCCAAGSSSSCCRSSSCPRRSVSATCSARRSSRSCSGGCPVEIAAIAALGRARDRDLDRDRWARGGRARSRFRAARGPCRGHDRLPPPARATGPVYADPDRVLAARDPRGAAAGPRAHRRSRWFSGSTRLVGVAYGELTSPDDVAVPIVLRVLSRRAGGDRGRPPLWVFGEIVGGLARGGSCIDGRPVTGALGEALRAWSGIRSRSRSGSSCRSAGLIAGPAARGRCGDRGLVRGPGRDAVAGRSPSAARWPCSCSWVSGCVGLLLSPSQAPGVRPSGRSSTRDRCGRGECHGGTERV